MDKEPELPSKIEDRIKKSFLRGYIGNIAHMTNKNKYRTCFPEQKMYFDLDRDSIMKNVSKKPKIVIYNKLANYGQKNVISGITGIPASMIKELDTNVQHAIKNCSKPTIKNIYRRK